MKSNKFIILLFSILIIIVVSFGFRFITTKGTENNQLFYVSAPLINQMPELPRGCEVTSLAMLLNDAGIEVDKMDLAKEIERNPAVYKEENGQIYFGNPKDGFVGDIYSFENPGLGVYHQPIYELANKYLPNQIINLSNNDFEYVLNESINKGTSLWVIINTEYKHLPDHYWETWNTPTGKIKITYKEHSVLVTGYDTNYVYFNDPLTNTKRKISYQNFKDAWEQMGKQAITYSLDK